MRFFDRLDAGQQLAQALRRFEGHDDVVVLALPRGGVVLGGAVAKELEAPLGLVLVRKIGHPAYPEYAIGAVAEAEAPIYNLAELASVDTLWLQQSLASAREVIAQRHKLYYGKNFAPPNVAGKTVILVDDGIATGLTMEAAVHAVRNKHAKRIIVAAPVASPESVGALKTMADEVIVLDKPENFSGAVGAHYQIFEPVDDEEVRTLLREVRDELQQTASTRPSVA